MYFNYTIDELADEPIVLIDRHIGMDEEEGMGIMGDQCAREIMALDGMGKKRIQVWINSVGGAVMDAMAIYNAILKSNTKVDTYNVGVCASSAGLIFQAGRKRYMNDYALLMMHNPFNNSTGDSEEAANMLNAFKDSVNSMIATRSGRSNDTVSNWMAATTWMNASAAFENNLCDEISVSSDYNKKRMTVSNDAKAMWASANKILNSLNNNKTTKMDKVFNYLKLNTEASEDALLNAIKEVESRATTAEASLATEIQNRTALEASLLDVQNKLNEFETAKTNAENEAKKVKAKVLVETAIKAGKIKNEASAAWEAKAVEDFEGTEVLLNSLTGSIEAPKHDEGIAKDVIPYNAAVIMADIKNKTSKQ